MEVEGRESEREREREGERDCLIEGSSNNSYNVDLETAITSQKGSILEIVIITFRCTITSLT